MTLSTVEGLPSHVANLALRVLGESQPVSHLDLHRAEHTDCAFDCQFICAGPIVYKTAQAAAFLFPEALSDRTLASRSQTVPLSNNTGSLFAAYVNSTLILAFNVRILRFVAFIPQQRHRLDTSC